MPEAKFLHLAFPLWCLGQDLKIGCTVPYYYNIHDSLLYYFFIITIIFVWVGGRGQIRAKCIIQNQRNLSLEIKCTQFNNFQSGNKIYTIYTQLNNFKSGN